MLIFNLKLVYLFWVLGLGGADSCVWVFLFVFLGFGFCLVGFFLGVIASGVLLVNLGFVFPYGVGIIQVFVGFWASG